MPQEMTQQGVAARDRHEVNHEGQKRVIYDSWEIGTYDPDNDGTGNSFDPRHVYGHSRIDNLEVHVADGSPYLATYDYEENAIRLYDMDGTGEVTGETAVNVTVRVNARGMGQ